MPHGTSPTVHARFFCPTKTFPCDLSDHPFQFLFSNLPAFDPPPSMFVRLLHVPPKQWRRFCWILHNPPSPSSLACCLCLAIFVLVLAVSLTSVTAFCHRPIGNGNNKEHQHKPTASCQQPVFTSITFQGCSLQITFQGCSSHFGAFIRSSSPFIASPSPFITSSHELITIHHLAFITNFSGHCPRLKDR
jgi:hypothetical protein